MHFNDLRIKIKETGIFSLEDVFKWFPSANRATVKNQLREWTKREYLRRLKRNLYLLAETKVKDEFIVANRLCLPSYVSLESALNYYGIIPEIPFAVTSATVRKTQEYKNQLGLFLYRCLKPPLFCGWKEVKAAENQFFLIATPEKALFDFVYLNQYRLDHNFPQEERFIFTKDFNWPRFKQYCRLVKTKKFKELVRKIQ